MTRGDQRNTARARVRYQSLILAFWISEILQYGSGLPSEADSSDIPSLVAQYGQQIINKVNFNAGRVRPNFSLDASLGVTQGNMNPEPSRFKLLARI